MSHCLLCGGALPRRSWWRQLFAGHSIPTHDGADRQQCWRGFNLRMGLDPDRPMPR